MQQVKAITIKEEVSTFNCSKCNALLDYKGVEEDCYVYKCNNCGKYSTTSTPERWFGEKTFLKTVEREISLEELALLISQTYNFENRVNDLIYRNEAQK